MDRLFFPFPYLKQSNRNFVKHIVFLVLFLGDVTQAYCNDNAAYGTVFFHLPLDTIPFHVYSNTKHTRCQSDLPVSLPTNDFPHCPKNTAGVSLGNHKR